MQNNKLFITGGSFQIPTDLTECPEAFESMGKMCRKCPVKSCYRNGWLKKQVDADNKKIVKNIESKKSKCFIVDYGDDVFKDVIEIVRDTHTDDFILYFLDGKKITIPLNFIWKVYINHAIGSINHE